MSVLCTLQVRGTLWTYGKVPGTHCHSVSKEHEAEWQSTRKGMIGHAELGCRELTEYSSKSMSANIHMSIQGW